MSESGDGFRVAATRQNAGRLANRCVEPGGVKSPAGTDCATAIVTVGKLSAARDSQAAASVEGCAGRGDAAETGAGPRPFAAAHRADIVNRETHLTWRGKRLPRALRGA